MPNNNEKKISEIKKHIDIMASGLKGFYGEYGFIAKLEDGNIQSYEKIVKQKIV